MAVRNYLMMSTGKGAATTGSTSALTRAAAQTTPHVFQCCLTGTTAQRPVKGDNDFPGGVPAGVPYYDSTLTYVVFSDGTGLWRNPANGNAV